MENFKTLMSCITKDYTEEQIKEIYDDGEKLNKYMQEHFLDTRYLIKLLFIKLFKYKVMHTNMERLQNILDNITEKISENKEELTREKLVEFLSQAYKEFGEKYKKIIDSDKKLNDIISSIKERIDENGLHVAVLGTNHIFANIQYQKLLDILEKNSIKKEQVHIHILCKNGVNKMLTNLGSKTPEDNDGEDEEMNKVFDDKGFGSITKHVVNGENVGTNQTLVKFFEDFNCEENKDNLMFLCCPNTLHRQEEDVKLFLSKKGTEEKDLEKIPFITFEYDELIERLENYSNKVQENIGEIKDVLLKNEVILSSILSEMAKEFYALQEKNKLTK